MASIFKNNGKYTVQVSYKDEYGKYHRKTKSGFLNKTSANKWASNLENKKFNGENIGKDESFSKEINTLAYFDEWFKTYKEPFISFATKKRYEHTRQIINNNFNKDIKTITKTEFQQFINEYGENHSKATLKKLFNHFHQMIKSALDDELISKDFLLNIKLISQIKEKEIELKYLKENEIKKLLENLNFNSSIDLMIFTSLNSGTRFAETAGITFKDIKNNGIDINKNYNELIKSFKETKNEQSKRFIELPVKVLDIIKNHSKHNNEKDFIFKTDTNNPPSSTAVNKRLKTLTNKLKITPITFHGLRHTHVSILINNDVDVLYISKRAGHKDSTITLNTYTHLLEKKNVIEKEKTIEILENKINGLL